MDIHGHQIYRMSYIFGASGYDTCRALGITINRSNFSAYIWAPYRTYVPEWLKDISSGLILPDTMSVLTGTRKIYGKHSLPDGYAFAFVPRTARVKSLRGDRATVPAPQRGVIKGLVSLAQAIYAFYTLFQARGDQISRYGYAAFGLTALPYAVMSTINLIGTLLTPEFDALYVVQSDTLLEARDRFGGTFEGVVGTLLTASTTPPEICCFVENVFSGIVEPNRGDRDTGCSSKIQIAGYSFGISTKRPNPAWEGLLIEIPACGQFHRSDGEFQSGINEVALYCLLMGLNVLVYSIIFGMTSPQTGGTDSTPHQKVFIVLWLVFGTIYGTGTGFPVMDMIDGPLKRIQWIFLAGFPALGGFYFVAQMLMQYGICTKYD
jgi:hypothetical protein